MEQLSIAKVLEAQFGVDLKGLFRPNPNVFKSCCSSGAEKACSRYWLDLLNLKEPWCLVIIASGRQRQSLMACVI